jgi:hypothetical protein
MSKYTMLMAGVAVVALAAAGAGKFAVAQQPPQGDVIGELANNEGIFVDGKTFKIARGKAKGDPAAQIAKLGAKEVGPGAIVFRYNDKLYMVEGTPTPAPQAMKNFQDNWNFSYMKGMKDFQDNFAVSYMKDHPADADPAYAKAFQDFQNNWNVSYMKGMKDFQDNFAVSYMKDHPADADPAYAKAFQDFQNNWNVSYMKAAKDFQDSWNVSYMKNFQDNWNTSYMKAAKDFQDNWSTSYMK